jgi:hypothetical protein
MSGAAERGLLLAVLFNRESAIAFNSAEKGRILDDNKLLHVIPTVPHKAWQAMSFRIPAVLRESGIRILEDQLLSGSIERSFGSYWNPWFLVEKHRHERDEQGNLMTDKQSTPLKRYG